MANNSKDQDHMNHKEEQSSHHNHHQMMIEDFKKRFYISLVLTIPILILSPTIQSWFSFSLTFSLDKWVLLILSSIVFFYGGWPFLKGSYKEIKETQIGMMTLIAVAITVAYLYSVATLFGLNGNDFFWELATLILIMLLGHWIEMKSLVAANSALNELAKLLPNTAHLISGNETKDVPVEDVKVGDRIKILPGEKIPLDGVVSSGKTRVDESVLTGESELVSKQVGDELIAGSINESGTVEIEIKRTSDDSYISNVIKIVKEAQAAKSKTQNFTDKAAFYLTIIAISIGIITFVVWFVITKDLAQAITRMATVMVITCPHALGLAIPLVVANSTTLAAKNGLIIRNRTAFEESRNISLMVFDKTGTLTEGSFAIREYDTLQENFSKEMALRFAASLEQGSEHPIAVPFLDKAKQEELDLYKLRNFQAMKGKGIKGIVNKKKALVVSEKYLSENEYTVPTLEENGTKAFLIVDDTLSGYFILRDEIRPESKAAIKQLHEMGMKCWMLTGDNKDIAKEVADELNLDGFYAEVLPEEKQDKIKELQKEYDVVAMTGDGVNDAPALAQANIGVAIGSGTDVAIETSDIILANSNPQEIVNLTYFGKQTYKKMIQNIIWATAYNVVAIPLAAGVLYNQGIVISPAVGAVFMSLSTVIVAINAKLLSFKKQKES